MRTTTVLRCFALSRVALGLWLTTAPQTPGELWFGSTEHPASTTSLIRSVGARDIGLGLDLFADPRAASLLIRDRVPARNFFTGFVGAGMYALFGVVVALIGRTAK